MSGASLYAITLIVPDYDPAIRFFCDVLGFELLEDRDEGRKRWVTVAQDADAIRIVLARADGAAQSQMIGNQGAGRVWLFLACDDFAAQHARMQAAGITFEEAPRIEPYGTVAVWRDPWGNRWDLIERAKA